LPHYDLGAIENVLEGRYRPDHFQGVAQVVDRLLQVVQPDILFLGRKDYQQCMVIKRLIDLTHLATVISIQPTLREKSGLAMSSRNMRLSEDGREKAVALYNTLMYIKEHAFNIDIPLLIEDGKNKLLAAGFEKIDYIAIADANTLQDIQTLDKSTKAVLLAAAYLDGIRLIDNMPLSS
jgi:pantoate--beta-alanine ligase